MPEYNPPDEEIVEILKKARKIAVVGLSSKEERDSNKVARYLLDQGYEVIPVNPGQKEILGLKCYKSLEDIPFDVDMADLFINPKKVSPIVEQAIEKKIPVIWMQLGVVNNEAARKARQAGAKVVMNRCVKIEHQNMVAAEAK
ncbi:MAG TPA: CoA-binding protein [Desulfobacterales bacterium]|nr:CoA-binding protein [Desulfobacterales bacterium]